MRMANQTPVVAQDVGGVHELVRDGVTDGSFLMEAPEDLVSAITHAVEDRAVAQQRAFAARALVEDAYALEPAVRAVEHLYLERSAAGPGRR